MINPTPYQAPFPIDEFLKVSPRELADRSWKCLETTTVAPCAIPVRIGLFFDGTNNNMERDLNGERIEVGGPNVIGGGALLPNVERSHSNVVRLFQVYEKTDPAKGKFSYYIPGVGTRFVEIGEPTETSAGKAFAKGGQARIIYALLQVINSVYGVLRERPLYSDSEVGAIARKYGTPNNNAVVGSESGTRSGSDHVEFFEEHISRLKQALDASPKPSIPSLSLDVFGFSRGAAEAVAFCHMFDELLVNGKFASIPAAVQFLGVFDTVASVGISNSVARTMPFPEFLADGHNSWAARIKKRLPPCVRSGRHFIAAHEQRMNFPITTQSGPEDFLEFHFPGVHSDVGGGYGPGEGGKGRGSQSALLSQIPLAYMYKEAFKAGVPLKSYDAFPEAVKEDFEVDSQLASAWNAYCSELVVQEKKHGDRFKAHLALYYYWRAARLETLEKTEFFKLASKQAQQDLRESNRLLKGDLAMVKQRSSFRFPGEPLPELSAAEKTATNQWHIVSLQSPPSQWELWALSCFEKPAALNSDVLRFFDDYVHDSIAGFYLAGEVTEYDKRVKVASIMKSKPEKLRGFDKRIFELSTQVNKALEKKKRGEVLSPSEELLVKEAETGTPYPVMTDDDAEDMRNPMIATQTWSRREGGGYLLMRRYFPRGNPVNKLALGSPVAPSESDIVMAA